MALFDDLDDFHSRVSDAVLASSVITKLPAWITKHTTLKGEPWSFKDHEFQIGILEDEADELCVIKPSQMGLTEVQVRAALALLSIKRGFSIMYVMPHIKLVQKVVKGRVDPVIDGSDRLSQLVVSATNSSEMKRFGMSMIYFAGASTDTQAISMPVDALFIDEFDFCKPSIVGKFQSRLRHAQVSGGMRRNFSTPTVSGYGISLEYETSSKARYLCKCEHCEQWIKPHFHSDVVIPGFDKEFSKFDKEALRDPTVLWQKAYIKCNNCGKRLDESLAVASRRQWVHEFPEVTKHGYAVKHYDLISHNSTPSVLAQRLKYDQQDYENFVLGETFRSTQNEINADTVRANSIGSMETYGEGYYIGVDVGKTCHVTIGKKVDGRYQFVRFLTIKENQTEELLDLFNRYGANRLIIDSAPSFTLYENLQKELGDAVTPCVYVKEAMRKIKYYSIRKDTGAVNAIRTKGLDAFVLAVNEGRVIFPACNEMKEVVRQYGGMKRIEEIDEDDGERKAKWVKTGDEDHFFHSSFYCMMAMDIDEQDVLSVYDSAPVSITSGRLRQIESSSTEDTSRLEPSGPMGFFSPGRGRITASGYGAKYRGY